MMLKRWRWFCLTCFIFLFNVVICNGSNRFCCWIRELLCYLTCSRTTLGTKFNDLRLWLMQRAISSRWWWKELMGLCFSPRDGNPCVIFMVSAGVPGFLSYLWIKWSSWLSWSIGLAKWLSLPYLILLCILWLTKQMSRQLLILISPLFILWLLIITMSTTFR